MRTLSLIVAVTWWVLAPQAVGGAPAEEPTARTQPAPAAVRVLVVTGGHEYSTSFYTVFEQDGLAWDHAVSNEEAFRQDLRGRYDAVVLYDMATTLSAEGRRHFRDYVESGGGVVSLHHSIASNQDWPWFHELIGGRYVDESTPSERPSTYLHDQDLDVHIVAAHPITSGVVLPRIHDETYKWMAIAKTNTVLLTTDHATSDGPLAWVSAYPKARVVYIQLGHGPEAHHNAGYRTLVGNAIRWVAQK